LTPANVVDEPVPNIGQAQLISQAIKHSGRNTMTRAKEKIHYLEKWITSYILTLQAINLAIKLLKEKIMAL